MHRTTNGDDSRKNHWENRVPPVRRLKQQRVTKGFRCFRRPGHQADWAWGPVGVHGGRGESCGTGYGGRKAKGNPKTSSTAEKGFGVFDGTREEDNER